MFWFLSFDWTHVLTLAVGGVAFAAVCRIGNVVRYIPNDRVGVVEKIWSLKGSVDSGLIALSGEAGFQPDTLRGGFHFFFPFQYQVHTVSLVTIPQGQIGIVFARDGEALPPSQTLASNHKASEFQDVRAFLAAGGQKGPQRKILRDGVYAINLAQFVVLTADNTYSVNLSNDDTGMLENMHQIIADRNGFKPVIIKDSDDMIGIITVHDGPSLPTDDIIAPPVGSVANEPYFHNNFQDPEAFLQGGGFRGRQYQVLVDGTYCINPLFATVEKVKKTTIEVGTVGVVVSYFGKKGSDISGEAFRHGELVEVGCRGVWNKPLLPGKYAFNTYAGKIKEVPTTNIVLKWAKDVIGSHKLDANLAEITLITQDAFEPAMPLSVVIHINYLNAPLVVQQFGDIQKLVDQTLDPMVSAYFKNIGQKKKLIELLQERAEIQDQSSEDMKHKFEAYSLELKEVLIGTPRSVEGNNDIEPILMQLRERQIATERALTYAQKQAAAVAERSLNEQLAIAQQQTSITQSEMLIQIKGNEGKAAVASAEQEAAKILALANAEAAKIAAIGAAEAGKIQAIGLARAAATAAQVKAYGGPQFQLQSTVMTRFAEAVEHGRLPIVPQIVVGGGGTGSEGSLSNTLSGLMALTLADKAGSIPSLSGLTPAAEEPATDDTNLDQPSETSKLESATVHEASENTQA